MILNKVTALCILALLLNAMTALSARPSSAAEGMAHTAWLSSGEDLGQTKNTFSLYEKVYCILRFPALAAGQYTINSDWITPEMQVEQHNTHTFHLKKQSEYTYYAWLSLLKNGPLKRMVTGSDINREFQGTWQVKIFINGQPINTLSFSMD